MVGNIHYTICISHTITSTDTVHTKNLPTYFAYIAGNITAAFTAPGIEPKAIMTRPIR